MSYLQESKLKPRVPGLRLMLQYKIPIIVLEMFFYMYLSAFLDVLIVVDSLVSC